MRCIGVCIPAQARRGGPYERGGREAVPYLTLRWEWMMRLASSGVRCSRSGLSWGSNMSSVGTAGSLKLSARVS